MNRSGRPYWGLLGLFVVLLVAQVGILRPSVLQPQLAQLGWEYGHVAESLLKGEGFANPFGYETGPTAWMPPGIVAIYTVVFAVLGSKTYMAGCAMLVGKVVALTATVALLGRCTLAWGLQRRSLSWLLLLSGLAFVMRWDWLSGLELDESFNIALSAAALLCLGQLREKLRFWHIGVAVALPMTSPSLAMGFVTVLLWRLTKHEKRKPLLVLLLATLLATAGWTVRNGVVLGRFIPIKSNLWFEFYLSNLAAPSGLLSTETLVRVHPSHEKNSAEMKSLGEVKVCELYRHQGLDWLREHPGEFLAKVAARARSIFVYSYTTHYFQWSRLPLEASDAEVLKQANLLWVDEQNQGWQYWLFPDFHGGQAQELLNGLPLKNPEAAWQSWKGQIEDRRALERRPLKVLQAFLYSFLPTAAMVIGFCWGYGRYQSFREAVVLYLLYFLPYLLVSYTQRYQVSAMGIALWLIWLLLSLKGADQAENSSTAPSNSQESRHFSRCQQ